MIESRGRAWTAIAPLFNFEADSPSPILVQPNLEIRRWTTEDEKRDQHKLMQFMIGQLGSIPWLPRFSWVLSNTWTQDPNSNVVDSAGAQTRFDRVIEALHLIRDEMVAFPFVITGMVEKPELGMGLSGFPFPPSYAWSRAHGRPFRLTAKDQEQLSGLTGLVGKTISTDASGPASIALGRLSSAQYRTTEADQIIDFSIALETLLLRDAEGELSYRQAIRGAHLLGGTPLQTQETFSLLRRAYDRRSKIVHGARDPGQPSTQEITQLTRQIVRRFLERLETTSHEELIKLLDQSAVKGE